MRKLEPINLDITLLIPIICFWFSMDMFIFYLSFVTAFSNVAMRNKCMVAYNINKYKKCINHV